MTGLTLRKFSALLVEMFSSQNLGTLREANSNGSSLISAESVYFPLIGEASVLFRTSLWGNAVFNTN